MSQSAAASPGGSPGDFERGSAFADSPVRPEAARGSLQTAEVEDQAVRAGAPRVSLVIPALNEAENLREVLARLPEDVYELIVVDGGSVDGTVDVVRALWPSATVVTQSGRGKGDALSCGFSAATGDVIVAMDADGSTRPEEIPLFVDALCAGADFVKGSRYLEGGGSADITFFRTVGNRALNRLVNVLYGTRYSDLCYGYNAFWRSCLPYLHVDCDGFEVETLMNVRAAAAGLVVAEVPSFESPRIHGESKLHPVRDGFRVLRTILRERFSREREPVEAEAVEAAAP